jgi:hypothetical protein
MDVLLGLVLGVGSGLMVGRLYGGVWPLGRSWWRSLSPAEGGAQAPPPDRTPRATPALGR